MRSVKMKRFAVVLLSIMMIMTSMSPVLAESSMATEAEKETVTTEAKSEQAAVQEDAPEVSDKTDTKEESKSSESGEAPKKKEAVEEKSSTKPDEEKEEAKSQEEDKKASEKTESTEEVKEDEEEKSSECRTFVFENDDVVITVTESEPESLPEGVKFKCKPINVKSKEFIELRDKAAETCDTTDDDIEMYAYDIEFVKDGKAVEPKTPVSLKFEFKDPISVAKKENTTVIHFEDGKKPEVVATDIEEGKKIEEFEVELDSLSPVVVVKSNLQGTVNNIDEPAYNRDTYISKTPNINEDGTASSYYSSSQNITDIMSFDSVTSVDVVIDYATESTSWDWLYIKDKNGNIITQDADGKQVGDSSGKIGGGGSNKMSPTNTVNYRFETDQLQFVWRTDSSVVSYGYYAKCTVNNPVSEASPLFHFEELEDGTVALVFDRGGEIEGFVHRTDIQDQIADYKDRISEIRLHKDTTAITKGAFKELPELTKVTVPSGSSLTLIGDGVFAECSKLANINIPDTVTKIGNNAFRNTDIDNIEFGPNLTTIGDNAFKGCDSLSSVSIPASVTSIGDSAFRSCSNITDFVFEEGTDFETLSNDFFNGMTSLKNVTLPSNLTAIPKNCFYDCKALQQVDIPDTVTSVGDYAFYGCSNLKDFDIPANIKTLGTGVFQNCTSLKDMSIPITVTSIGSKLFYGCNNLIKVEFETGSPIATLPSEMFYGCSKLETVKLPDNVTAIPASYFYECSSLKHVNLPENLKTIGDYAFYGCRSLEDIPLNEGLKTIGTYAFYNCDALTEVVVPKSVTSVGSYAWYDCDGLVSATFDPASPLTSLGSYTFRSCDKLEELVLPPRLTSIPSYLAEACPKLRDVTVPDTVKTIGDYAFSGCRALTSFDWPSRLTTIGSYAFRNSGLTEVDFPSTLTTINSYAFYGTPLSEVTIPNKVSSVSSYAFYACPNLEKVTFEQGGSNCTIGDNAFSSNPALKDITLKDNITSIGSSAFSGDKRNTEIVIPTGTTSVGSYAFSNNQNVKKLEIPASSKTLSIDGGSGQVFANLTNVEDIIIDRDITSSYKNNNNFNGLNPDAKITIGEHVNTLDNMIVSLFNKDREVVFEGENDFSVSTRTDNKSQDTKWLGLKGDFYVDPSGVVYKLNNTNNTASVFHIPMGLTEYTVPETIISVAGKTYTINKIESHAVRDSELASLTVEKPENVSLPQFSLGECSTLLTVNGKAEIFPEEWDDVSLLCGFPVHSDNETEQVLLIRDTTTVGEDDTQAFSFGVTVSGQEKMAEDGKTYVYPTGMPSRVDIAISNESNVDMSDRVIRIYFAFDGENYNMGNYNPGQDYTLVNTATNSRYPFKVRRTDADGVYYYDISGFKPGDTLAFNNNFSYTSPNSGGGTLRIWAESISAEEAAAMEGKVSQPDKYILSEWYTTPVDYNLTKQVNGSPQFQFTSNTVDEDDENIYVKNLTYKVSMSSSGSSGNSYAKDYITYVDFEDDLQLNENMQWNPAVIEAIRSNNYYITSDNILRVKLDGKWVTVCSWNVNDASLVRSVTPKIVTDENGNEAVKLCWSYRNTYWSDPKTSPSADLPAISHIITLGNNAIMVKPGSNLWGLLREGQEYTVEESAAMRQIANKVQETTHYSYSNPVTKVAETADRPINLTTGFTMDKTMDGTNTFGEKHEFVISMSNTGLIHKTDVDIVEDSLRNHYYIPAGNLTQMFNDAKWGPYLKVDIASATLCAHPDKTGVDIYGHQIDPMVAQQSGIDPIPYNGCATEDASVITASAKLSLHWNDDRSQIVLDVKNDAGEVQQIKTIGAGGNYATIEEALNAIGYVVTYRAEYKVTWDLGDEYTLYNARLNGIEASSKADLTEEQVRTYEYRLKSGKTDTFRILSKTKDTLMMLTRDEPGYYPNNSLSSGNTAYARDDAGRQVGVASWSGTIYRELSLDKSATVDGTTFTSGLKVPDNSVITYNLSFSNSGDTHEILPLSDRMSGSQVLLVPIRGNRNALYYAEGSTEGVALSEAGLDTHNDGGVLYYILDKPGSYTGVTIDGRITDIIKVSTSGGSADTLMIWYYTNVGDGTKSLSYKALTASARLGGTQGTNPDGSTVTHHSLNNQTWLGGHQTHRLYDSVGGRSEAIQFRKAIVEDPNAEKERLIYHSLVQSDDAVLYKIVLKNTSESPVTITGNRIRDELPTTKNMFAWSKDNITDLYYVTEEVGSHVNYEDRDHWYVDDIQPGTGSHTADRGMYYIHWTDDFKIDFEPNGEVWIYVRTQYPGAAHGSADAWDNYITRNNGAVTTNYFYVDERQSSVTHELVDVVTGKLQKGVLDTGLSGSGYFQSESTRDFYQNGANSVGNSIQEVSYYTVVYNSGNVRLYLDPLRDQLPKGIKFRGLFNRIPKAAQTQSGYSTTTSSSSSNDYNDLGGYYSRSTITYLESYSSSSSYIPVATVTDGDKTITYKNARVEAAVTTDAEGKEQVIFTLSRSSNGDSYLKYDSTLNKYYLDPGEAVRFGYNCYVEGYSRTENVANNEVAMPVYDKYGLGVTVDEDVTVTPAMYRDITPNDGGCDLTTTEQEHSGRLHGKSGWVRNTTPWFSSNVSLRRLAPVPGVQKTVGGETVIPTNVTIRPDEIYGSKYTDGNKGGTAYVGTIGRTSIANWRIRAYNEGGVGSNSMEDYWIVDTVDAPYSFTGNYFYDYYNVDGSRVTASSVPIFSLGGRSENDRTVKISTGTDTMNLNGTLTINGPAVSVDNGRAEVQLLRDEHGVETLRIHLIDPYHRIPPNSYMELYAHTQYVSSDAVLSKQFYNHVELQPSTEFDPALVSQGKVLYRDVDGEPTAYAIESGASVTMTVGYTSAARKQVTEMDHTSNTGWSNRAKNSILLPEKYSKFYYDMYVDLPEDDPTSKLVMIDSLPQEGDHSPFVARDYRDSEFPVHILSENPGFRVWSTPNLGSGTKIELTHSDYVLDVSTKTEFEAPDWDGNGSGWSRVDLSDGISEAEAALLENARSFRIIITDPNVVQDPAHALMGKNYQIQVRFNAEILDLDEAEPGEIAWNSFGYRYTVPIGTTGLETSLNAEPLKVGVQIPAVPKINKDLKTPDNHYKKSTENATYKFLVYSGTGIPELNDVSEMSMSDIASILSNNSRDVLIKSLTVEENKATAASGPLDEEHTWTFDTDAGRFVETDNRWVWTNNSKYTILELPWAENGFVFQDIQHSSVNNYTFVQNNENNVSLRVTNVWNEKGRLAVEKKVNGSSVDPNRRFTFTVHLQDGRYPVSGTYNTITHNGENTQNGVITFNDSGDASVQLKKDEMVEILNVPSDYTYSVTEADDELYTNTQKENESGTIVAGQMSKAEFTNTRKDTTLSVNKTVTGGFGERDKAFDFEVYVIDEGRPLNGSFEGVVSRTLGGQQTMEVTFEDGMASVSLRDGETLTVSGLPVGARYQVNELAESRVGYTYTSQNSSGVLTETGAQCRYTNNKDGVVPTGLSSTNKILFSLLIITMFALIIVVRRLRSDASKKSE